ncbi:MAG: hypothetical protein HY872_05790 [Chloroflexi bacterium]|nr:hypothetical protein [Chloroflexota bacterium]MBI5828572.1 hypothetical protein [Chloroflexota bacterium]
MKGGPPSARLAPALILLGVFAPLLPFGVWAFSGHWLFPPVWPTDGGAGAVALPAEALWPLPCVGASAADD